MHANGSGADEQCCGNLGVGASVTEEMKHVDLPRREAERCGVPRIPPPRRRRVRKADARSGSQRGDVRLQQGVLISQDRRPP